MNFSQKMRVSRRPASSDRGFALPLALAVLLVLSMIAIILTERILTAQSLTRSDTSAVDRALEFHIIEQDLIWRALLELYGIQPVLDRQRVYVAEPPSSPWPRDGTLMSWNGNYLSSPVAVNPDKKFSIRVKDVSGLIDVNYANREYIQFLAEKFEVPAGQKGAATDRLLTEIQARKPSMEESTGIENSPLFMGLHDVTEICAMTGWSASRMCRDEGQLKDVAYAGLGMITNISLASPEVKKLLLGNMVSSEPAENRLLWRQIQQDRGFIDFFISDGEGYQTYQITVKHPDSRNTHYLLDVRIQPDQRPYRLYRIRGSL